MQLTIVNGLDNCQAIYYIADEEKHKSVFSGKTDISFNSVKIFKGKKVNEKMKMYKTGEKDKVDEMDKKAGKTKRRRS